VALEGGNLVAQDQDLCVFGLSDRAKQGYPAEQAQRCQVGEA
jgi:hypothetical protein